MTEPVDDRSESKEQLRPIPDGGLATTLPDWLKERPAWSLESAKKSTLPPDASAIDPRLLVREQDLPNWLQAIARRETRDSDPVEPVVVSETPETPIEAPVAQLKVIEELEAAVKPEWMTHAAGQPVIPAESTVDMQRWLNAGDVPPPRRKIVTDPVLLGFIAAGLVVILVALYLVLS